MNQWKEHEPSEFFRDDWFWPSFLGFFRTKTKTTSYAKSHEILKYSKFLVEFFFLNLDYFNNNSMHFVKIMQVNAKSIDTDFFFWMKKTQFALNCCNSYSVFFKKRVHFYQGIFLSWKTWEPLSWAVV